MSKHMNPAKSREDNGQVTGKNRNALETKGPAKNKAGKVLNKDGSFADLPYNNQPGGGPNEGTVGIGT